jgi:antitoxin HicB
MTQRQAAKFDDYAFEIRPLTKEEGGGFLITWPDLPGCMADGETPAETLKQGKEAFRAWMRAQAADGREIPPPGSEGEPAKFVQRLPKSLHYRLVQRAKREGVSLNTLVTALAAEGMGKRA